MRRSILPLFVILDYIARPMFYRLSTIPSPNHICLSNDVSNKRLAKAVSQTMFCPSLNRYSSELCSRRASLDLLFQHGRFSDRTMSAPFGPVEAGSCFDASSRASVVVAKGCKHDVNKHWQ